MARNDIDLGPYRALASEMLATGKFNPEGINAYELWHDFKIGMAVVLWSAHGERIKAYGSLHTTKRPSALQVRKLFVAMEHRGNGNGTDLIRRIVGTLLRIYVPGPVAYFAVTDNPKIVDVLAEYQFKTMVFATSDEAETWADRVGYPRKRIPENAVGTSMAPNRPQGRLLLVRSWG